MHHVHAIRPRIGITLDWQESGSFSKRPHYALREQYFTVVDKAGGLPVGIPYLPERIDEYIQGIDGLMVPGGFFASPESWYVTEGEASPYEASPRLEFDLKLIEKALERDMPVLGICAGMQMMAGLYGCKMTHDVQKNPGTKIDHINGAPAEEYAHKVTLTPHTRFHTLLKQDTIEVNSAHREAVIETSKDVLVNAKAEDGVIEGIEIPGKRFAIGVQWHPEFFVEEGEPSFELIRQFVNSTKVHL